MAISLTEERPGEFLHMLILTVWIMLTEQAMYKESRTCGTVSIKDIMNNPGSEAGLFDCNKSIYLYWKSYLNRNRLLY